MITTAYAADLTLMSPAFKDKSPFPTLYTCNGKNISPPLVWSNVPPKTQAFALVFTSPDWSAGSVYLWVLYNIPADVTSLPQGANRALPEGIEVGINYYETSGYNGPCPPDNRTHRFVFTIYALDSAISVPFNADPDDIMNQINNHTIQQASLTAFFQH